MGILRVMLKLVEPITTIPKHLDYHRLKSVTYSLGGFLKKIFVPTKAARRENFEEAVIRLRLTDENLAALAQNFYRFAWFYLGLSCVVFIYSVYLIIEKAYMSGSSALVIAAVILAYAFRQRFWYFQIKTRYLGYTFQEWFHLDLLRRKPHAASHDKKTP